MKSKKKKVAGIVIGQTIQVRSNFATHMVNVPKGWVVIMHDKTREGDKFWHLLQCKFIELVKKQVNKRVSRFELLIRKEIAA
jgi:hypothetical protein